MRVPCMWSPQVTTWSFAWSVHGLQGTPAHEQICPWGWSCLVVCHCAHLPAPCPVHPPLFHIDDPWPAAPAGLKPCVLISRASSWGCSTCPSSSQHRGAEQFQVGGRWWNRCWCALRGAYDSGVMVISTHTQFASCHALCRDPWCHRCPTD